MAGALQRERAPRRRGGGVATRSFAALLLSLLLHVVLYSGHAAALSAEETLANDVFFSSYPTLAQLYRRWKRFASAHPAVRLSTLSYTHHKRAIPLLQIGHTSASNPKRLLFNSLQHAREWISVIALTYAMEFLMLNSTRGSGSDPFGGVQLLFLPMLNPDGYAYSHLSNTTTRYWRKNRRPAPSNIPPACLDSENEGVDLNRNWGKDYNGRYASTAPCADDYVGPYAFSEPETHAVRRLVQALIDDDAGLAAHLDVHSYGQVLLAPWAFTDDPPPQWYRLDVIGNAVVTAIMAADSTRYRYERGHGNGSIFAASGTMTDWMYSKGVVSYTLELRPEIKTRSSTATTSAARNLQTHPTPYTFLLDAAQIRDVGKELVAAIATLIDYARDRDAFLHRHKIDNDTNADGGAAGGGKGSANGGGSGNNESAAANSDSSTTPSIGFIAGIIIATLFALALLILFFFFLRRRSRRRGRELVKSNILHGPDDDAVGVFHGAFGGNEQGLLPRGGGGVVQMLQHDEDAFSKASFENEMVYVGGLPPRDARGMHMEHVHMEDDDDDDDDDDATVKLNVDSALIRMLQQQADEQEREEKKGSAIVTDGDVG